MTVSDSRRIAIIGAGFIGKHLIRTLLHAGHVLSILDRNVCPAEFSGLLTWSQGDFHDQAKLSETLAGTEIAYHLVSSTVPGDLHIDVARELHDNVVGSMGVAQACVEHGVGRLVFASSASVYGVQEHFPVAEDAPTWPISAHGIHKLAVEKFLWLAHQEHELDVRILRLANPYGPGQNITGRQGFVAIAIGCLVRGDALTVRDSGRMVRDFIYIEDAAQAFALAGLREGLPLVLNIGAGEGHSLCEVVDLIEQLSGKAIRTVDAAPRQVDIPVSVLDVSRAQAVLNFTPRTGLRKGIIRTLKAVVQQTGITFPGLVPVIRAEHS
jgi:UDP-glucose 4-epimerase